MEVVWYLKPTVSGFFALFKRWRYTLTSYKF